MAGHYLRQALVGRRDVVIGLGCVSGFRPRAQRSRLNRSVVCIGLNDANGPTDHPEAARFGMMLDETMLDLISGKDLFLPVIKELGGSGLGVANRSDALII